MLRFKVPFASDSPEQARQALDRAGIPTFGPALAGHSNPESWKIGPRMTTVLEADSGEAAEARVREVVGDGCRVGPAEPIGESG
jgi:hypothetical protein